MENGPDLNGPDLDGPDLTWVTKFDEPVQPRSRALTVTLAALFGGGALAAVALLVAAMLRPPAEEVGAEPTRTPSALPTPSATQTASAPPSVLPSGCGGLYSEPMRVTLEQVGLDLDSDYSGDWQPGSADAELRRLLAGAELDCHWTDATAGLLTQVAEVDDETQAAAISRLEELGFTRISELGGVRYVIENQGSAGATGESHFFRDGVWFATHWIGHGQYGYTADMVGSVFG